jgi:hypothetical protein
MKANELRIGNWVEIDNEKYHNPMKGIPMIVTGIADAKGLDNEKSHSISLQKKDGCMGFNQFIKFIKPISINIEWLNKLGFSNDDGSGGTYEVFDKKMDNNSRMDIEYDLSINIYQGSFSELRITHIQFIHELQNLWFALTGEELD